MMTITAMMRNNLVKKKETVGWYGNLPMVSAMVVGRLFLFIKNKTFKM